jgi:hypothetical protein
VCGKVERVTLSHGSVNLVQYDEDIFREFEDEFEVFLALGFGIPWGLDSHCFHFGFDHPFCG